jgi:hypothetical protein
MIINDYCSKEPSAKTKNVYGKINALSEISQRRTQDIDDFVQTVPPYFNEQSGSILVTCEKEIQFCLS